MQCVILVVISPADNLLAVRSEQDSLERSKVSIGTSGREVYQKRCQLTCSNWAVYEPFLSTRGG